MAKRSADEIKHAQYMKDREIYGEAVADALHPIKASTEHEGRPGVIYNTDRFKPLDFSDNSIGFY